MKRWFRISLLIAIAVAWAFGITRWIAIRSSPSTLTRPAIARTFEFHASMLPRDIGWPQSQTGDIWQMPGRYDATLQLDEGFDVTLHDVSISWLKDDMSIMSCSCEFAAVNDRELPAAAKAAIQAAFASNRSAEQRAERSLEKLMARLSQNRPAGTTRLARTTGYPCVVVAVSPSFDGGRPWLVRVLVEYP